VGVHGAKLRVSGSEFRVSGSGFNALGEVIFLWGVWNSLSGGEQDSKGESSP
jgi:hypothetical protein